MKNKRLLIASIAILLTIFLPLAAFGATLDAKPGVKKDANGQEMKKINMEVKDVKKDAKAEVKKPEAKPEAAFKVRGEAEIKDIEAKISVLKDKMKAAKAARKAKKAATPAQ